MRTYDLNFINQFSSDFEGLAWFAVDDSVLSVGRPFGGLAVMWKKTLYVVTTRFELINDGVVYCMFKGCKNGLHVVNVYMPCAEEDADRKVEYIEMLSCVAEALRLKCTSDYYMVVGDFNACAENGFLQYVTDFCLEEKIYMLDMVLLDQATYTFENIKSGSKSWLDHVIVSGKMQSIVVDCKVDYAFHVSDHLPLLVEYEDRFGFSEVGIGLQGLVQQRSAQSDALCLSETKLVRTLSIIIFHI